jgi:hypothetical protein
MDTRDQLNAQAFFNAALVRRAMLGDSLHIRGRFHAKHYRAGRLLWEDTAENVVTTLGRNAVLDEGLAGSAFTVTGPYMGLISSVGWTNLATTITAGTYTAGAVSLTTAAAHGLSPGDTFTIDTAAGTGSFAALNGTFIAGAGTTGSTLDFTIVNNLTMTITGGNVTTTSASRINDTMASHANWTEAGATNAPTYGGGRKTAAWAAASGGTKSLSAALSFLFTGSGTVEGAFMVFGTGALSTVDNTAGTLLSAGAFQQGARSGILSGDTLNVSYSMSI